jgi:hypothetical protein
MRPIFPWLCVFTVACGLPSADHDLALANQTLELKVSVPTPKFPSVMHCSKPGKPSCPECRVQRQGDEGYVVRVPGDLTSPVYLGDPSEPQHAILVWPGGKGGDAGVVELVVPWYGDPGDAGTSVPAPDPKPAVLFWYVSSDCPEELASSDSGVLSPVPRKPE